MCSRTRTRTAGACICTPVAGLGWSIAASTAIRQVIRHGTTSCRGRHITSLYYPNLLTTTRRAWNSNGSRRGRSPTTPCCWTVDRSEEHTSELQSRGHLVCRLLLDKKNKNFDALFISRDDYI